MNVTKNFRKSSSSVVNRNRVIFPSLVWRHMERRDWGCTETCEVAFAFCHIQRLRYRQSIIKEVKFKIVFQRKNHDK